MKYSDGTDVRLGQRVRIGTNGDTGFVVVSIDTNEFDPRFCAEDWADLKAGILIVTDTGALTHLDDPCDSRLLTREPQ
ncbi:MAG TPA: hypothetical protein VKG63_01860 [Steroidobacteraceae bacterium]|nr:hypothetical protein [Steroidobacteraceae bacterium]